MYGCLKVQGVEHSKLTAMHLGKVVCASMFTQQVNVGRDASRARISKRYSNYTTELFCSLNCKNMCNKGNKYRFMFFFYYS